MVKFRALFRPVPVAHFKVILGQPRENHNHHTALLPHHLPHVCCSGSQRPLSSDVCWVPRVVIRLCTRFTFIKYTTAKITNYLNHRVSRKCRFFCNSKNKLKYGKTSPKLNRTLCSKRSKFGENRKRFLGINISE